MSGKMFKRRVGKKTLEKGASYKRGTDYDLAFAAKFVKDYLDGAFTGFANASYHPKENKKEAEHIASLLESHYTEGFEPQLFLDRVVHELGWCQEPMVIISPLLQALYKMGHNDLQLNLTSFTEQSYFASSLTGTEEKPLIVSFRVNGPSYLKIGEKTNHVRMHITGDAYVLGDQSDNAYFRLHGTSKILPRWSQRCELHLDSLSLNDPCGLKLSDSIVRVENGVTLENLEAMTTGNFFKKRNTLLVPDGKGGWNRIVPDSEGWKEVPE